MEKVRNELQVEAVEKESRAFECPKCHTHLQFMVRVNVFGVKETMTGEEVAVRDGRTLPSQPQPQDPTEDARRRLLEQWKREGIFAAFEETVRLAGLGARLPSNTEDALVLVMEKAAPLLVPKFALRQLLNEFGKDSLTAHAAYGVAFVMSSGKLRCFIPQRMLTGELARAAQDSKIRVRVKADEDDLETWIRTRHGYVVGNGAFAREMSKRSAGDFANTGI